MSGQGLCLGEEAPDFALRDQFGQDIRLTDFRGRKAVVLMFFPFAFSGVCTGELSGVRDRLDEFLTFDTEVLALSCDPVYALRSFAEAEGLHFPRSRSRLPGRTARLASAYDVFDAHQGARPAARRTSSSTATACCGVGAQREPRRPEALDEHLRELQAALH